MGMRTGKRWMLIMAAGAAAGAVLVFSTRAPVLPDRQTTILPPENGNVASIRSFMGKPDLEVEFVTTDLPMPYFRVGKVTKIGNGENMDPVDGWTRMVNVYDQKDLIDGQCSTYQYHTDERNNSLTAVLIKGLKPAEVDELAKNGVDCAAQPDSGQKLDKNEAETIAMQYLGRAVANFDSIKPDFEYSTQPDEGSHERLWEDNKFRLPEGVDSRPYGGPTIRISVYGKNQIQYWNTVALFGD